MMAMAMATGSVLGCRVRCRVAVGCRASLYDVLQVPKNATPVQIKTAYRKLALQHHPDVSSRSDSQEKFIELSKAYEILIDDLTRATYDTHGLESVSDRAGNGAAWDVWNTWDEFKPFKRTSRKGDARASAAARTTADGSALEDKFSTGSTKIAEAQLGDVVEYYLSDAAKAQHQDGRLKGVGLVVSRNIDRGDRHKLPLECVDLVELEPLYKEVDCEEWRADPMEGPAFASMPTLRILRSDYERTPDFWRIHDELSPDCGSPEYAEEVIL
ncbi:hypothetical protein MPTK1_3g07620 [Marchantia polymorpha subsp. ruderalis]|uniref:J domain-containing protein n=2 Tax=Marchantia polymorpha TaxID=3197 RepID=A0AAF6AYF3_MARPO|nr:hypothetical protein MARPO_0006s0238 [Marchantia polymorpha]BBN04787.1 hypothetical protein Mp_3g07620 [Marchantia polymorpha subsp. ruderalis]|eukprot:PTQ48234.1 hypothetical protein MARPO_0006s0238 [Marchantia polymorpha]